jgi:nitrogen fixation protein NifB
MQTLADQTTAGLVAMHPCYTEAARLHHGRLHLAVAPDCNLGCRYCERSVGAHADGSAGPGTAARVLPPAEANSFVSEVRRAGWLRVVGIAGPGEPLANPATLATLRLLQQTHPDLLLCLSTNGIELEAALPDLLGAGVRSLTVTINAVRPGAAARLYAWAAIDGRRLSGKAAAEHILKRQWDGLAAAVRAGLLVKVNSVLIPGITGAELESVARRAGSVGAHRHNIMPLIPRGQMRRRRAPTRAELEHARARCERWIPQFRGCTQCRADAIVPPLSAKGGIACATCT